MIHLHSSSSTASSCSTQPARPVSPSLVFLQALAEEERRKWHESGSPLMMADGQGDGGENGDSSGRDGTVLVDYTRDPRVGPSFQFISKGGKW